MEIAPTIEMSAAQNAADGGGAKSSGAGNVIGRTMLAAKLDHPLDQERGSSTGAAMRA